MTVINTNIKALYTQNALKLSNRASQEAMQQLSTGKRINSSKDDAAGLAIAARMTQNIKGMNQAIRNSGDAISLIQVAEGATNEITNMLQRMSELAVQSSNSTYSPEQRSYLDEEFQQLKQEIVRISETHEWNGFPILNGKAGTPVGAPTTTTVTRTPAAPDDLGRSLKDGDLEISGVPIEALAIPVDNLSSKRVTSSNPDGSAISIAAAINQKSELTGVLAVVNPAEINAHITTVSAESKTADLYINDIKISMDLRGGPGVSESARRQYVINRINEFTSKHGVVAGDGGNGGLSLKTTDGRNLSIWYEKDRGVSGSDFGLGEKISPNIDATGVTGVSKSEIEFSSIATQDVQNLTFPTKGLAAGEKITVGELTFIANKDLTGADVIAAFEKVKFGDVSGGAPLTDGSYLGKFTAKFSLSEADGQVITATSTGRGEMDLIMTESEGDPIDVSSFDLGTGIRAATVYGTVTLKSNITFSVGTGANAASGNEGQAAVDPSFENFRELGFYEGTYNPKNIGRLSFQVGPSPDQLISIDFADFGKNGDITGAITSETAPTNILTVGSANEVTQSVNKSLDMIAKTRASMGAVMNRLQHVIDNLDNVVMNSEASRSQIEDADYAKASTELARTQIMQQAATAVLAQANSSQQSVLKLLQG